MLGLAREIDRWPKTQRFTRSPTQQNRRVRAAVPSEKLIDWQPGEGWAPLCAALGVAEPGEQFPHVNTTETFQKRMREATDQANQGRG